ncbi:MAG: hypothetical protein H7A40_04060 [Chlamydiales bacterium]|nr:hypothetical protein [Chlamydiales bacterium]
MPVIINRSESIGSASQSDECELDLSGTTFREFSAEQLEILQKVTKVKMSKCVFWGQPFPKLNTFQNIKVVDLSDNKIAKVPEYRDGIKVILDDCPIREVPSWVIKQSPLPSLQRCPIMEIPEGYAELDPQLAADVRERWTTLNYEVGTPP